MKNAQRIITGLLITAIIFLAAKLIAPRVPHDTKVIPDVFISLSLMLLFSIIVMVVMRKNLGYHIAVPKWRTIVKPVFLGIATAVVINLLMSLIVKLMGQENEIHPALLKMTWVQVFLFVFLYASMVEEILFRGFLLNYLKPLSGSGVRIFKRYISLPVLISALAFGAAHLSLITSGVHTLFLVRVVIFTFCLGTVAGYYQEKYNNNAYAIIVHMSGNSFAVLGAYMMSKGVQ